MLHGENVFLTAALPAFWVIVLRPVPGQAELQATSHGILTVTATAAGPMLVNGQELRLRSTTPSANLLTGLYYLRQPFTDGEPSAARPLPGDIIGLKVRDDLVVAYEVRVSGPGSLARAAGALEPDGIACEFRPDLGSIHLLAHELRSCADSSLH